MAIYGNAMTNSFAVFILNIHVLIPVHYFVLRSHLAHHNEYKLSVQITLYKLLLYIKTINFLCVPSSPQRAWQYITITTCSKTSYIFGSLMTTFRHMTIQWKRTKTSKACHYANSSTRTKSTWKLSLICGQISHSSHMPCGSLMNRTFVFHCSYR